MRPEEVKVGSHKVGAFTISVQKPVYQDTPEEELTYFELLLLEQAGTLTYVDVIADDRFNHFQHLKTFSRKLIEQDIHEFNAHVSSVFHKIAQPTFQLSRASIAEVFELCHRLSKKKKA